MIPIWIAVIIAGITYWLGFFTCALLAISKDRRWEGKIDKKTATFDSLYVGHDRRRKNRDVDIEYIKVNGVEYNINGDTVDNAVYQHMEDKDG
ncbi:hypothetical protein LCGC14_2689500 [marine sediment metagenome]|uniref:Uncharacterized protein n=1 Tax=marine sediment metagenome TaxID=412755 RepID=A0A0F9CAM2_9ZZZZ